MDALDIGIIRTMGLQPYGRAPRDPRSLTPSFLARALKISAEAVRERIARMEAQGVIEGYEIYPNFAHLGLNAAQYSVRPGKGPVAPDLVERLESVDGLVGVYSFLGGTKYVAMTYRSLGDEARKLRLLLTLAGDATVEKMFEVPLPFAPRPLSAVDWRILRALRGNARRPLTDVARELKVSAKTVKRRFERMAAEGSFFVIPVIDPAPVPGIILFEILAHFSEEAGADTVSNINRALSSNMVCSDEPRGGADGNYAVGLYATSLGDVEKARLRCQAVRGVRRAEALVLQGSVEKSEWVEDALELKIRESQKGPAQ